MLLGAAPAQALFFLGFTQSQKVLGDGAFQTFCAGFAGQVTGALFWVPMEVIKEKMMIQGQVKVKNTYTGSFHMIKNVLKNENISGL